VERITTSTRLDEATAAVQQVLAKGGVATASADKVYMTAVAPVAPVVASPTETLLLARDARQHGAAARLTADQLGRALRDLHSPFAANATPGEHIIRFLAARIRAAQFAPDDPRSFTWLFLSEMSKRKLPPVDLATGTAKPEEVRFNLLELELFATAFLRGAAVPPRGAKVPAVGLQFAALEVVSDVTVVAAAATPHVAVTPALTLAQVVPRPGTPYPLPPSPYPRPTPPVPRPSACTAVLDQLMPPRPGSEGAKAFGEDLFGTAAKESIQELLGLPLSESEAEHFGDAVNAISMLLRAQKLVALGSWTELTVTASEASVHKPAQGETPKLVVFTARAGVNEEEWAALQKIGAALPSIERFDKDFKDCMALIGPGMFTDLEALAKEAENWQVQWEINPQNSPHVDFKYGGTHPAADQNVFYYLGLQQSKLKRRSGASAETEFRLRVLPEEAKGHKGRVMTAEVEVCARLKTEKLPSLGVLVDAAGGGGGLASAVFEILTAMWRTKMPKTICTTLEVTYHQLSHGYRFRDLVIRFDTEMETYTTPKWGPFESQEGRLSGQMCGDDPLGNPWGLNSNLMGIDILDFQHHAEGPKYARYMKVSPDGQFRDVSHFLQYYMLPPVLPAIGKRAILRLLPQSPLEIELTVVPDFIGVGFRVVPAQQDGQTVRAPVEEIWDCEPDSEEWIRSTLEE
jgi:hypothetical protein